MLLRELNEAIEIIDAAVENRSTVSLSLHRFSQINRILRWYQAHWRELEPVRCKWAYPERREEEAS